MIAVFGVLQIIFSPTDLFLFVNNFVTDKLNLLFEIFTWIGSGWTYATVCLLVLIFNKKYFWMAVSCFAATGLLAQLIKYLLPNIPRPITFFSQQNISIKIPNGAEKLYWNSFPSGHTVSAFSMFLLLSFLMKKNSVSFLFAACGFFVAISRVYLTAHFVRDTYVGMIIGVELTGILIKVFQKNKPF